MHNPDFIRPSRYRRSTLASLVIYAFLSLAVGCQPKSNSPVNAPEPKPAAAKPDAAKPSETADAAPPSEVVSPPTVTSDAVDGNQTEPKEELRLKPPPGTAESAKAASAATSAMQSSADTTESPDVGDVTNDDEYEIDPKILAHIEAQKQAIRRIADTYAAPPGAKQLGKNPDLWVDMKAKRVYVDGYVAMRRGPLEMFACPVGTKEHESVVAVFAKSSEVHAALLAIGAQSGTPVRWNPDFLPPTGQDITVWATWRSPEPSSVPESTDEADPSSPTEFIPGEEFHAVDAREWVRNMKTKDALAEPWVFAGSTFWSDPEDNIEHYSADAGDMICVSNFSSAMLDVPFNSSADAGNILFEPFSEHIPERGTPVRLVLVPQPIPSDKPAAPLPVDPTTPPDKTILPIAEKAGQNASEAKE